MEALNIALQIEHVSKNRYVSHAFTLFFDIFAFLEGCWFPGFNIHAVGASPLEVSSSWEVMCDCKEGHMGKNLRRKRSLEKTWCAQQDPEDWKWL